MKRFLSHIFIFSGLLVLGLLVFLTTLNGHFDPFYLRFTSDAQKNLILGTSRAAQGIQPEYLSSLSDEEVYNYSFTIGHSPYGPAYFESIKKKLANNTRNGVFIVTVDPWSISSDKFVKNKFPENDRCVGTTYFVNLNPNPLYIFNNYNKEYYNLITDSDDNVFLHDDGWLEVTIKMDAKSIKQRTDHRLENYRNNYLKTYKISQERFKYLIKTIEYLEKRGSVYLVRLPIHPEMFKIEEEFMPEFDLNIKRAINKSTGYLDMTLENAEYKYLDGNHLYKDSGKEVSKKIRNWISKQQRITDSKN